MKIARYGWVRDLPRPASLYAPAREARPGRVDHRPDLPGVYDQGELGACTGNALAAAITYERGQQGLPEIAPSRLMLYYDGRAAEGTTAIDAGAQIHDVVSGAIQRGVCPEELWPYDPVRLAEAPSVSAYAEGAKDCVIGCRRVIQDIDHIRAALSDGDLVVFGFTVYSSFESEAVAESGVMSMPALGEVVIGGHAVLACGYDDSSQRLLVRNSWGADWGEDGYFWMPYTYVSNPDLASDLWTIRLVTP